MFLKNIKMPKTDNLKGTFNKLARFFFPSHSKNVGNFQKIHTLNHLAMLQQINGSDAGLLPKEK